MHKLIKKLLLIFAGSILFLSFIQLSWLGYKASFRIAKLLPAKYQQFLNIAHFKTRNTVTNLFDSFYLKTYFHSSYAKDLKKLDLIMSQSDLNIINEDINKAMELGFNNKQTANNQSISLFYNNIEYPAKISLHGGGTNNNVYFKTDYNIKLSDDLKIDNLSSFTLFNPAIHNWIVPLLTNQLATNLDLYIVQQYPIMVNINSQNYGIYLLEEKINAEFLANHQLPDAEIIKLKDSTRLSHRGNPVALDAHHLSGLDFEIANIDTSEEINPATLYRLDQLFKAIKGKQVKELPNLFDLDYMARFDAYREFFGVNHNTTGDNLAMFYSSVDNKFYPIVRSEGDLNKLSLEGGTTLKSFNNYDPHLAEQYDYPRLFLLLHLLPEFRLLKYQYLNQLISNYSKLNQDFNNVYNENAHIFIYDTTDEASVIHKKKLFKYYLNTINNNRQLIKNQLEFGQIAVNLINHTGYTVIEVVPDAVVPIEFTQFVLNFENGDSIDIIQKFNHDIIMAEYSDDYDLLPTTFSYTVDTSKPVISVQIKAKNKTTNQEINSIYSAIATP